MALERIMFVAFPALDERDGEGYAEVGSFFRSRDCCKPPNLGNKIDPSSWGLHVFSAIQSLL